MLDPVLRVGITTTVRLLTGARCRWVGCGPTDELRIYYANHTSHMDFVLLWSALPPNLRRRTCPVAAADYWQKGKIRPYLIHSIFSGVMIDRERTGSGLHPLSQLMLALDQRHSLIFFPEGTRGSGDGLLPFKSGLYHLAAAFPNVDLVPVWMTNSYRVLPKGSLFPVPLLCSATFGQPTRLGSDEHKADFLHRLRQSLLELESA